MNEHRPAQNPGLEGNQLAKAADALTSTNQVAHSWLDDAVKKAYGPVDFVKDTATHAPIGTALTALGVGVGIYGAFKIGLPAKALASAEEAEFAGGAKALAGASEREALAAGSEALGNAGKTLGNAGKTVVHLTTPEGGAGIARELKIGSRWGVFGLDNTQVPANGLVRKAVSLVPKDLSVEVPIGPNASSYFKAPTPVGPFTLARNLAGVKSTPLGSIDLVKDTFRPNEILSNGVFRPATSGELTKYKVHQWLLDYATDGLGYTLAGISTAALEYRQICLRDNQKLRTEPKDVDKSQHKPASKPDGKAQPGGK
jgi:hypothetical protein